MGCDCASKCPGSDHCACIKDLKSGVCTCDCNATGVHLLMAVEQKLNPDALIDLTVKGADLASLGRLFASVSTAEVAVPAMELDKSVTLSLKEVRLDEAAQQAGLILRAPDRQATSD